MYYNIKESDITNTPRNREIWMCELSGGHGCVQTGYRPVLIVSNNLNNAYSPTVNIVPITSKLKKKLPVHVVLDNFFLCGLKSQSTLLVEQITTVSADSLRFKVGEIYDSETIDKIRTAILIQLSMQIERGVV